VFKTTPKKAFGVTPNNLTKLTKKVNTKPANLQNSKKKVFKAIQQGCYSGKQLGKLTQNNTQVYGNSAIHNNDLKNAIIAIKIGRNSNDVPLNNLTSGEMRSIIAEYSKIELLYFFLVFLAFFSSEVFLKKYTYVSRIFASKLFTN
jgi:hypothetical protein